MATVKDLEKQLDALNQETRLKRKALQKEIAKRKRQDRTLFVKTIGELAIKSFPDLKTEEEFRKEFEKMNSENQISENNKTKDYSEILNQMRNSF